jgi:hypothetical protein
MLPSARILPERRAIRASEKHIRDNPGMMKLSGGIIDLRFTSLWAEKLNLADIWGAVLEELSREHKSK